MNEVEAAKEIKTFRVFKENQKHGWDNMGTLDSENYHPSATELGDAFGVGKFMFWKIDEGQDTFTSSYFSARVVTIEATTYFSEKYEDE